MSGTRIHHYFGVDSSQHQILQDEVSGLIILSEYIVFPVAEPYKKIIIKIYDMNTIVDTH